MTAAPKSRERLFALASETEPFCRVVTPDNGRWSELGHKFCVRVREYTRMEPAQVSPEELTESDYERYNLVLFGSILDNPAILELYARGRCFTDAAYPGPNGAEIRTLRNPLGRGRDVLLIGGSDYAAVHEAAIGLNRTFLDVSTEVDGVLCFHSLNFCVTADHHVGRADHADIRRALAIADGDADALVALAAEFALCQYMTDDAGWGAGVVDALRSILPSAGGSSSVGALALGWGLTHGFDGYEDDFRERVDDWLGRSAREAGARLRALAPGAPLALGIDDAMAVIRVADHQQSARGRHDLGEAVAAAWDVVLRGEPGFGPDGLRDWRTVDAWLGAVLRAERYDLMNESILDSLTREAIAERDNLGASIGRSTDNVHTENALRKIGAYKDSGEPLWLRRWMRDASGSSDVGARVPVGWLTGAYAADRAPTPARDVGRIQVTPRSAGDDGASWVTLRRDLDGGSEYAALYGDTLTLRRLTYRGHTWLADDVDDGPPAPATGAARVVVADLDGLGFVQTVGQGSRHTVLWRHGEFLLFFDDGAERLRGISANVANNVAREDAVSGYLLRAGMSAVRASSAADLGAGTATALGFGHELAVSAAKSGAFRVGGSVCYLGGARAGGASADAAAVVLDGDAIWFVGFTRLEADGVSCLTASSAVHLRLSRSTGMGRVHAADSCRLAWNDGADGLDLAPGSYDVQLGEFDWTAIARLSGE